jgi:vitamin K-dependent gamma-carboxylase
MPAGVHVTALRSTEEVGATSRPWWRRFFDPVDGASIAVFRILFGAIMLIELWRYFTNDWIAAYYITPSFHFTYYGFGWVKPWPGNGMYWHFAVMAVAAVGVMLGAWYRVSAVLLFLTFTYVFLLDQAQYLNHFYLICLLSFLMIFVPAHRMLSIDAKRKPRLRSDDVPAWARWLLLAQFSIVYIYAGLAKLNGDWVKGEPMRSWLAERTDTPLIGRFFTEEWMVVMFNYGGVAFDLFIVPLLLWKRTRVIAFLWVIAFHMLNVQLFNIGIFPWLMLGATLLYFRPDWPRLVFRKWKRAARTPVLPTPRSPRIAVGLLIAYVALQLAIPLRHLVYPGNVHWTEEGHRFSWHMKLRDKQATAHFYVTDPERKRTWEVSPRLYLTVRQTQKMSTRPDMILQMAHHVARDQAAKQNIDYPLEVRARVVASLHGRDQQLLIDPTVNLAAERRSLRRVRWVLPLNPQS